LSGWCNGPQGDENRSNLVFVAQQQCKTRFNSLIGHFSHLLSQKLTNAVEVFDVFEAAMGAAENTSAFET